MSGSSPTRRGGFLPIVAVLVAATVGVGCAAISPPTTVGPGETASRGPSAPVTTAAPSPVSSARSPGTSRGDGGLGRRLLLLSGRTGAMHLEVIGDQGERRPIPLPDAGVAWLSTSRDGRALATALDGRTFVSQPLVDGADPEWRPVSTIGLDRRALAGPLAFGTLAPDGAHAAFIAADFASGGAFDVVVLPIASATGPTSPAPGDSTARGVSVTRVRRPAEGAPPAWLGARFVVLARTTADEVGLVIVDPDTGVIDEPPALGRPDPSGALSPADPIAGLSISADGRSAAVASGQDGRVEIYPAGSWRAGAPPIPAAVELRPESDGTRSIAWLALAPDGERLAIVRTSADGGSVGVTIHAASSGWRQDRTIALGAVADRAVVAWLP